MGYNHLSVDSIQRSIKGLIRASQESRYFLKLLVKGPKELPAGHIIQAESDLECLRAVGIKYAVRATSIVCLLGVGIGLGSFFLYRLWNKVFPRPPKPFRKGRSRPNTPTSLSDSGDGCGGKINKEQVLPDSPDSGCLTMGNTDSNQNSATVTPDSPTESQKGTFESQNDSTSLRYRGEKRRSSLNSVNSLAEGEYGSFVVLDNHSQTNETPEINSSETDVNLINLDLSENSNASHSFIDISMQNTGNDKNQHLKHSSQNSGNKLKSAPCLDELASQITFNEGMQGSVISSISTDLGFVSGNYTSDHWRDSSQEPPSYDTDSHNHSLQSLKHSSLLKEVPNKSGNNLSIKDKNEGKNLMSFKEIHSDLPNYSMSPLPTDRSIFSDGFVSYSFLNESKENASNKKGTPPTRALSDSGGGAHWSSFNIDQATHSTPQCDSDDELFKAMKRTPKAPKKLSQTHHFGLRRNCSFTSEMSTTSDGSYYLFGGHSVDLGENLSGRSTPDSDAFRGIAIGGKTESNINELQSQIQLLRNDLDEMTEHIEKLNSRDNLSYLPEIDGFDDVIRGSRLPKTTRIYQRYNRSSLDGSSVSSLSEDQSESKLLTPNQGDFMWDYQSDLALGDQKNFVAKRPVLGSIDTDLTRPESPAALQHIKKYLQQQSQSVSLSNETRNMTNPGDMYIDDGISFQMQQSNTSPMERPASLEKGYTDSREKQETAPSQKKLCSECKNDCCSNCGKQINTNNNNNNSKCETGINTNITSIDTSSKSNYTQTDCMYIRSNSELTDQSLSCSLNMTPMFSSSYKGTNHSKCENCFSNTKRVPPIGRASSSSPTPVKNSLDNSGLIINPAFTSTPSHTTTTTTAVYNCNNTQYSYNSEPLNTSHVNCDHQYNNSLSSNNSAVFCSFKETTAVENTEQNQNNKMGNCCHCMNICHKNHGNINSIDRLPGTSHCCSKTAANTTCQPGHGCNLNHRATNSTENNVRTSSCLESKKHRVAYEPSCHCEQDHCCKYHVSIHTGNCTSQNDSSFMELDNGHDNSNSIASPKKQFNYNEKSYENTVDISLDISEQSDFCDRKLASKKSNVKMTHNNWEVTNVGERFAIADYVEKEWKGNTQAADCIRKGYEKIPCLMNLSHIRQIRGDNYCGLRSTVYQILVNCLPVHNHMGSLQNTLQKLEMFQSDNYSYLQKWNFANRLPYDRTKVYETVKQCVKCLYQEIQTCWNHEDQASREKYFIALLNSNPDIDLQLMEAVKCLMMINAIKYYEENHSGKDVPVFVWLLYARNTSDTPEQFMLNHLNKMGDSGGMEQVEMFLLGDTLGVKISVVRPYLCGKDDFITHFPDEGADNYPRVHLIAEDDRHYNVLVP